MISEEVVRKRMQRKMLDKEIKALEVVLEDEE